ncbi:armadillo repeat-containing protein 7-like isoform X2 [Saccostrea echinata]|uniref:armadillo repeat-containing protein 7-like isoform X2 n=1 Tax=Saccostrea echinata TaxID=191078 RepID=UPI002A80D386|nr:armadillo repeat-containing protein 7-like isoform X2 [Saccostrea echinata]
MFSTKEQLSKRTGPHGIGRFSYLQALVIEFQDTDSLDCLDEDDEKLVQFGIGGLCNLCLDKINKEEILKNSGVKLVMKCLSSPNEETVLSAITTLMFLVTPVSRAEITALPIVECMLRFSESTNPRLSNLAKVFLEDYCDRSQIEAAKQVQERLST